MEQLGAGNVLVGISLWVLALAMLVLRGKPREVWEKYGLALLMTNSLVGPLLFFLMGGLAFAMGIIHL